MCEVIALFTGCYDEVTKRMGPVSVMVNNAGIVNEVNWRRMLDINHVRQETRAIRTTLYFSTCLVVRVVLGKG